MVNFNIRYLAALLFVAGGNYLYNYLSLNDKFLNLQSFIKNTDVNITTSLILNKLGILEVLNTSNPLNLSYQDMCIGIIDNPICNTNLQEL